MIVVKKYICTNCVMRGVVTPCVLEMTSVDGEVVGPVYCVWDCHHEANWREAAG